MRIFLWPSRYNKGYFRLEAESVEAVSMFGEKIKLLLGDSKGRSLKASLVRPPSWESACKIMAGKPLLIWLRENGWPQSEIEFEVIAKDVLWLRRKQHINPSSKNVRTSRQREYDERNQAAGVLPDAYVPGSKLRKITKNKPHN